MYAAPADVRACLGILDGAYDLNIPLVLLRASVGEGLIGWRGVTTRRLRRSTDLPTAW